MDDGIATGATIKAAVKAIKRLEPRPIIVAVPVAAAETLAELESDVNKIYCLSIPEMLYAIGAHYDFFPQVSDEKVIEQLGF